MKKLFIVFSVMCLLLGLTGSLMAQIATHVVISEVYGGGGNSGSVYKNDFVELYNPTDAAISLAGWSIQYVSATNTSSSWAMTALTGSIPAHGFYLVQEAVGAGGTTNLPTPDAIGTITMSGTAGKVALTNNGVALVGTGPPSASNVVDYVGFGATANGYEGTGPTPAPSNTASVQRKAQTSSSAVSMGSGGADEFKGNGWDSNDNATDFFAVTAVGAIDPQNTASSTETPPDLNVLNDGAGTASVTNTGGGTFDATNIFTDNASQTVTVTVTGVSAGDLTNVQVSIPATWTGYNAANVTLGGAFTGATNTGTGTDILLDGVTLGTTPGTIVITNITSPNTTGAGMNGNDTWTVQTAKSGGTLTNIATSPSTYTVIPISNLRSGGTDGFGNSDAGGLTPVMNNQTVVVHGVVTVPNGVLTSTVSTSIIIQDGDYGMQVFKSSTNTSATLPLGTEIYVKGLVQVFDGNTEIVPSGVTSPDLFIVGTTTVPSPFVISSTTEISEGNESRLIQFNNATWDSAGQVFANLTSGRGINNFNGGTGTAYLNSANTSIVGKTIPASSAALVGVVYHRAGITGNQAYKLAPRTGADVGLSADGTGTASISPSTQVASTTALTETVVIKGDGTNTLEGISVTIPATWTWTNTAANISGPGFASASYGVTGDGSVGNPYVITVTGAAVTNLDSGIVSIPDLNAPTSAGLTSFNVKTRITAGTLASIGSSPSVNITAGANPFEAIATGDWNQGSVWYGGVAPGANDNVTFTTKNVVVTITDGAQCNNLTMTIPDTTGTGTGTVGAILQFPASGATTLTVNGRLDISGSVGRPVLTSNGNADAVLVCKGYVATTVSNTTANGNKGLNMNEGTVKFLGSTSDTLKNGAGLRLGNIVVGDGTNAKTLTWVATSSATLAASSVTVKNGSSFILGGTTYSITNSLGNFSTTGLPMLTGGVTVEANASLTVNNGSAATSAYINIKSGGITNNGTLNLISANSSRRYFVSFGDLSADLTGSSQSFSGAGTGTFSFVKVGALDTLTLNAPLMLADSLVWLNGQLVETAGNTVHTTAKTMHTVTSGQAQNFSGIGLSLSDAGAGLDTTTVVRKTGTALTGGSKNSILRYFDVTPKTPAGLDGQLIFRYDNTELNGQDATTLKLWSTTDDGTTWVYVGGTVDTTNHTVTFTGNYSVTTSKWTLADAANALGSGTNVYSYANGWNMVSVPLTMSDYTKDSIFSPSIAPGSAFRYSAGYLTSTTLANGIGYWLKFSGAQDVTMNGIPRTADSVVVSEGWNMVGSISNEILASSVTSNIGGMITSPFYAYANGYTVADTIKPGKGYWIKVNAAGTLYLSTNAVAAKNTLRMIETSSLPPAPPAEVMNEQSAIPAMYALEQNFPNPFNPSSVIRYQLTADGMVTLKVFNTLGVEVATLVNDMQSAGFKSVTFDASSLPSGVYYYRIQAAPLTGSGQAFSDMKKMMLVK